MANGLEALIKGAAVQDFYTWYAGRFGQERMVEIWARLPDDVRAELGPSYSSILAFHWYPASATNAVLDLMLEGHHASDHDELAREAAHIIVAQTLRGLYRMIFKTIVSPSRYLRNINNAWKAFHNTGRVEVKVLGPAEHWTEVRGWRSAHPFLHRLNGFILKEIYETMGCRDVSFEQGESADENGERTYFTEVRWKP